MPECSDCTCMLVCVLFAHFAHETAGAACTRHSLLPPIWRERNFSKPRAHRAARSWSHIFCVAPTSIPSSLRTQGPIRRGGCCLGRMGDGFFQQLATVAMAPCVRRDDG